MDDPRVAAKLKLLEEILQFASEGSAGELKSKFNPVEEEAAELSPDDESLPPSPDGAEPSGDPTAELSEDDLKKLLGG